MIDGGWTLASKYLNLNEQERRIADACKVYPINDIYVDTRTNDYDILIMYGGRGGGKSEDVCRMLIEECRHDEYFKCYYGRKVFDNVRGSCFETLAHNIKAMHCEDEFSFSEANNSSMIITCKANGNKFIPFGSDKASKLKSIKDPTHIWCEEFDQFDEADFKELFPTLRTERGKNRFIGTFNSYSILLNHWIAKLFFSDLYDGDETTDYDILAGMKVMKKFVNYTDNYFINHEDYYNRLKLSSGGNQRVLEGMANGAWGIKANESPWLYAYDNDKHTRKTLPFLPTFPVYLSFDFNREPVTCLAAQQSPNRGGKNSFIHFIKEFAENAQLHELCQMIKSYFPASVLFVTGDAAGNRGDVGFEARNQTYYTIIKRYLGITDKQLKLNSRNLEHNDSRLLMNTMFYSYPNIFISREGCPKLIIDCEKAEVDENSSRPGHLKKDRAGFKLDLFDGLRYFFQTYYLDYANKVYIKKAV